MSIEVMKKALEALNTCVEGDYSTGHVIEPAFDKDLVNKAITALRQAIEQAEQWDTSDMAHRSGGLSVEQAEKQETVAWMSQGGDVSRSKKHFEEMGFNSVIPLYTAPPKREWVELTEEEITEYSSWLSGRNVVRAIEAKLRERNT